MTDQYNNHLIMLDVCRESDWEGELLVSPITVDDSKQTDKPAKDVGDILLVERHDEKSDKPVYEALLSLGEEEKITSEIVRQAGGRLANWLIKREHKSVGINIKNLNNLDETGALKGFCEGLLLGSFRFDRHKSKDTDLHATDVKILVEEEKSKFESDVDHSVVVAKSVSLAREWSHEPPNIINPVSLAQRARDLAEENGLKCTILDEEDLKELGANAIRSVGFGSQTPSHLIILEYPGSGSGKDSDPVILVGKALTFDSGGYSLKSLTGIRGMKYDKCGGMTVLGTMQAVAELKLDVPVVGIVGAAENMISENAYRPDDIITTLSGKTVEIISTDAEGRMVLSDSLTYAHQNYQPRAVIDVATLTGGVVVALGKVRAGIMANDDGLADALMEAGERTHERLWRMPLDDDYFELIKGSDSDLKNSAGIRQAHPVVGGIFLKQFVPDDVSWAHLDIAGMASVTKNKPYSPKGATGFGVRLLVDYLENL